MQYYFDEFDIIEYLKRFIIAEEPKKCVKLSKDGKKRMWI